MLTLGADVVAVVVVVARTSILSSGVTRSWLVGD